MPKEKKVTKALVESEKKEQAIADKAERDRKVAELATKKIQEASSKRDADAAKEKATKQKAIVKEIDELCAEVKPKLMSKGMMAIGGSSARSRHLRELSETGPILVQIEQLCKKAGIANRVPGLRPD